MIIVEHHHFMLYVQLKDRLSHIKDEAKTYEYNTLSKLQSRA